MKIVKPSTHHAMTHHFGRRSERTKWAQSVHAAMLDEGQWLSVDQIVDKHGRPAGDSISTVGAILSAGCDNGWFRRRMVQRKTVNASTDEIAYRACIRSGGLDLPASAQSMWRPGMVRVASVFSLSDEVLG